MLVPRGGILKNENYNIWLVGWFKNGIFLFGKCLSVTKFQLDSNLKDADYNDVVEHWLEWGAAWMTVLMNDDANTFRYAKPPPK